MELDFATRLLFAGLWTVADKDGRLQDRPKKIKIDVFPADNLDIDAMLQSLHDAKFIVRYAVDGSKFIQINNWSKHQNPHHTEKASEIPGVNGVVTVKAPLEPREPQKDDGGNLADSGFLIPDSRFLEKKSRKARPSLEVKLSEYLEHCKAEGRKPIPTDHAIRAYCADAGITDEMLQVAWLVFKDRHLTNPKAKKYIDWPVAFANSVKDRWYRLWLVNAEGHADWSPAGVQERRVLETRLTQKQETEHAAA